MRKNETRETMLQIAERYRAGESASSIARALGWSQPTVVSRLTAMGVERHRHGFSRRSFSPAQDAELATLYRDGWTSNRLAEKYDVDKTTVIQALNRVGVVLRNGGRPESEISDGDRIAILEMYDSGKSRGAIARRFGLHDNAVKRVLRENDRTPEARRGRENHHAWKGGVYVDRSGYRRIRLAADDPCAPMCGANGYVMEHRVVMARALGRVLEPHETVHHIDGNRQHNALANLELRQGKHGNGVRFVCRDCGSHNVEAVTLAAGAH